MLGFVTGDFVDEFDLDTQGNIVGKTFFDGFVGSEFGVFKVVGAKGEFPGLPKSSIGEISLML